MREKRLVLAFSVAFSISLAHGEVLTPPYFNLANGRRITATATCGEGTPEPELYCKLVGANADRDVNINLIQGQVCDVCDPTRPDKMHPAEFAIDGAETWWQSPPLSRSMKLNEVNLTIDFGQSFHVAYVFIRMANSPRPGIWVLEKSVDNGATFTPWQYFADTPADCETYFGKESLQPITRDDSVICDTQFSKVVPLEGGEIVVSLLNNRPSAKDFFNSTVLQEWTKATNVRLRFLRTKTLLGHLMSVARQDPTVTRRYFYSIKDISIGGRCMCNGHAYTCDNTDSTDPYKLVCRCQHNTCGDQCQTCCPGFQQKAWKQSKAHSLFVCEQCNCFGHSEECEYSEEVDKQHLSIDIQGNYEGGGVCKNCRHNTEGINCNQCKEGYYRPFGRALNATDACERCQCDVYYSTGNCAEGTGQCECRKEYQEPRCDSCSFGYFGYPDCKPCECFQNGTRGYHCEADGGACPCKPNFGGKFCYQCTEGYFDFPNCLACDCNPTGSLSDTCEIESGNCTCKNNFGGRTCDTCKNGYYNYPECIYCSCDAHGTLEEVCDKDNGKCLCKEGFGGERCDQCVPGYYGYPDCKPCNCSETGSALTTCDATGKCSCLFNFAGRVCDQCSPGYYQYPECLSCECDHHGSIGVSCDNSGKCRCKNNYASDKCNECKEGFYNFPICEDCNCDPAGIVAGFAGCGSVPPGELCQCKSRVQGRICNECRPLYWNLKPWNPEGCEDCDCHMPGVLGGIGECDLHSGQCICKPGVESRRCDTCRDGFYGLNGDDLFGCTDCGCDIGGAVDRFCDKDSGQCICQPRVTGRDCKQPHQAHYFPTLYSQLQFEAEDSRTPSGSPVRYDYSEHFFPNYSWKGYAIFSHLQGEIIQDIFINKPSLYRMIMRYVNPTNKTITGTIKIVPDNVNEVSQTFYVQLKPSKEPTHVTVSGPVGGSPSPLVMNPGQWAVHISAPQTIFLDYFVLLPAAFYEATILEERVETPCTIDGPDLCRHFSYPELDFDRAHGEEGYKPDDDLREPIQQHYKDFKHLNAIKEELLPILSANQSALGLDINISKPGRHVLVVNYVTPEKEWKTSTVTIETSTSTLKNKGMVELLPCTYDQICRQVSTDKLGRVAVYDFDTNFVGLTLRSNPEENSTAVIQSVVAIPVENWSLDYIRPKTVCIKKDGECLQTTFPIAPESIKFEFEQEAPDMTASQLPNDVFDNTTAMIYMSGSEPSLDIHGSVPAPGPYVFVVHFYQPNHPEFNTQVLVQNGQFYEAKLMLPHCPGNSGCRALITQSDGNNHFQLIENFILSFKKPENRSLWLDYLLAIPADQFSEALLEEEAIDQTSVFITQCGNNNFDIPTNTTGFCRDGVFSLTTQYYDGALKCECHYQGSLSFECEQFGGQCQCKENVIGRRCDFCKSGYFGFPNCRKCSCPSPSICHNETGECICPPRVTGANCDECESHTFGYDVNYGCEECNCHPDGVENNNLQCDLYTGICQCKNNIRGRTCDHCRPGHYAFPNCLPCACDHRGTTEDVCDEISSSCFCKPNVYGLACDLCKEGTFHISERNPNGCTKCFCFGKTTRCSSSNLYRTQISSLEKYQVAAVATSSSSVNVTMIESEEPEAEAEDKVLYFMLPKGYLGNRLTSYGGFLNYTISFASRPFGDSPSGPDVILFGTDIYLLYFALDRPTEATPFSTYVEILENNFQLLTGLPATREQLMQVLGNLTAVYIRATYGSYRTTPRLEEATLDIATKDFHPDAIHALSVEHCHCPPNYIGLSCQECAPGFYRVQGGPFGGYCVPCQCNGHADDCDKVTGKCIDCKHNTYGDHCESCSVGYHGNATTGTPFDCLICACPLPVPSNNFATSCDLSEDGERISCNCLPGYYGARCEACAAGHYGRPELQGDSCKKCNCSGNIDPNDPYSCDSVTGECLKCLNNTFGAACNLCQPGFWGDAVDSKDCKSCECDKCGTYSCESHTGQCVCRDNVIGERCDRCADDYFGFTSCNGCYPCNCGIASESSSCKDDTGQCTCQPGVTGRTCDVCAPGFWNYSSSGCISCGCNIEYSVGVGCNPVTGQCECLPGVIGDRCDQCPHRWVLIPDRGCFECNSCTHDLLDTTDYLRNLIDPVMTEFKTVADGYFTTQRLRYFNDTANNLSVEVSKLDPTRLQIAPVLEDLDSLESELKSTYRRAEFAMERGGKSAKDGERVRIEALDVEDLIRQAADDSGNAVLEVANLANSLDRGNGPHLESAVSESIHLLKDIQDRVLEPFVEKAKHELGNATLTRDKMKNFTIPIANQSRHLEKLREAIQGFDDKLEDLLNHTASAQEISDKALLLNNFNRDAKLSSKVYTIRNMTKDANDTLADAKMLLKNATNALNDARGATAELYREKNRGMEAKDNLNATLLSESSELRDLHNPVEMAKVRAEELFGRAKQLNESMAESRQMSGLGVEAAKAYANIAEDILEAETFTKEANSHADNAVQLTEGIGEKTEKAKELSGDLLEQAMTALKQVEWDLKPQLDKAKQEVHEVEEQNKFADEQDENIVKELMSISNDTNLESASSRAMKESDLANSTAQDTLASIKAITDKVPDEVIQAKQLPKDIGAIKQDVSQARSQLTRVNNILPDINQLMNNLKDTQMKLKGKGNDVGKQIDRLKRQVAEARDLASRVKVGVDFQPNTFIEVKNPEDLAKQSTSTKVSAFFKSDRPNGALLYLGNEIGTNRKLKRAQTDDFLSVELENGHPAVVVDLGSGPHRINSDMNVTLGKWYQFFVERTGKHVKLTVLEESEDGKVIKHVKEEVIPGDASILNLDPEESKIYVGGHPASAKIQSAVKYSSFDGQMEDLIIGETPISLWNFKDAEYAQGAQERNRLINLNPSTGYRFNGNGYAVLDSRSYRMDTRSVVSLKFKTAASDGLLFLIGKGRYFLSLEIKNGKVVYQYNLGGGTAILTTDETFNDNRWHVIEATRQDQEGVLKVDDVERYKSNAEGPGKYLHVSDHMYFGGYPGKHHFKTVTNMDFDGCIDGVYVDTTAVDLSKHVAAFGVLPACPVRFSSMVALKEGQNAYIRYPNASADQLIDLSLRFKTQAQSGIILLTATRDGSDPFSLFLLNGELVVMSQGSILMSSDSPHYDDDQWHTITAKHDADGLKLSVDDFEKFTNPNVQNPPSFRFGSLLIGGVPKNYFVSLSKVGTSSPFVGCIADVTFNGVLINFANSTDHDGVTIGRCSEADTETVIIPHKAPAIPTEDEVLDKMPKFPLPPDSDRDGMKEIEEKEFGREGGLGLGERIPERGRPIGSESGKKWGRGEGDSDGPPARGDGGYDRGEEEESGLGRAGIPSRGEGGIGRGKGGFGVGEGISGRGEGGFKTGEGFPRRGEGGFGTGEGGIRIGEGGFGTGVSGSGEGGFGRREGGFRVGEGGIRIGEDIGTGEGGIRTGGGIGTGEGGFRVGEGGIRTGEGGIRTGGGIGTSEEGIRTGEGGFRIGEGGIRTGEGGFRVGEGGIRTGEGVSGTGEGGFGRGEGGFRVEGGIRTGEGVSGRGEGGFKVGEGGIRTGEGVSGRGEGGFGTGEGGFRVGEGGFKVGEGGIRTGEGVSGRGEGGFGTGEGGIRIGEGGFRVGEGGFETEEGGIGIGEGGIRIGEGGIRVGEGVSGRGEGGIRIGEGGFGTGEGGIRVGEGGFGTGDGGIRIGEGGFGTGGVSGREEGGFGTGEGVSGRGEGGIRIGEGGIRVGEGGIRIGEGGFGTGGVSGRGEGGFGTGEGGIRIGEGGFGTGGVSGRGEGGFGTGEGVSGRGEGGIRIGEGGIRVGEGGIRIGEGGFGTGGVSGRGEGGFGTGGVSGRGEGGFGTGEGGFRVGEGGFRVGEGGIRVEEGVSGRGEGGFGTGEGGIRTGGGEGGFGTGEGGIRIGEGGFGTGVSGRGEGGFGTGGGGFGTGEGGFRIGEGGIRVGEGSFGRGEGGFGTGEGGFRIGEGGIRVGEGGFGTGDGGFGTGEGGIRVGAGGLGTGEGGFGTGEGGIRIGEEGGFGVEGQPGRGSGRVHVGGMGGRVVPGGGREEDGRGKEFAGEREFDKDLKNELEDRLGRGREPGKDVHLGEKMPDHKGKKPKKPGTPKPTPMGLCALPLDPAFDPDATFMKGYRFGTQNGSRIEFSSLPGKNKNNFDYSLEFKTHYPDGLLFYSSDKRHIDFTALYMKEGKLFFGFNCGSGAALITAPDTYDDGKWHSVRITRESTVGNLIIDGQNPVTGESSGSAKTLNVISPYYLGGFDLAMVDSAKQNIQGLNQSFAGCIRNFRANNKDVEPTAKKAVVPCSEHTEPGIFFSSGGGYVRAVDSFRVGTNIEIKMEIKPRSTSGVLLAVHGKKDYLFLQMVNGVIEFTVDNGRGPFTSAYKPGDEYFFCDGRWHAIHAVQAKNVIVLSVDSFSVEPGIGTPGSTVTDTKHPLYLGAGGPRGQRLRGNLTSHQYVGCMKNVIINGNLLKINTHRGFGNVTVSSCPTI